METIKFRDWEVTVDREATQQNYALFDGGVADGCPCEACHNYLNYRENLFPDEIKRLFTALGVDYTKECENMHYQKLTNGLHQYHFWYHFKGKATLSSEEKPLKTDSVNNLSISFGPMQFPTFFDNPNDLEQIEFLAEIPWTIEKELESKYE